MINKSTSGPLDPGADENPSVAPHARADALLQEYELIRVAEELLARRSLRCDHFDSNMFGEPAWEMLLKLYIRDAVGTSTTEAQLTDATTPISVRDRWLQHLENDGCINRRPHPLDPATDFVELSDEARDAMSRYLTAIRHLPVSRNGR